MDLGLRITPPRSGTSILDLGEFYLKKSINQKKIESEYFYFSALPSQLKSFHPEVKRNDPPDHSSYLIKKIDCLDSAIVFASSSDFPEAFVDRLFQEISRFLASCPRKTFSQGDFMGQVEKEVVKRNLNRCAALEKDPNAGSLVEALERYSFKGFKALCDQLNQWTVSSAQKVKSDHLVFSHGDLCLSNTLLKNEQLYLIDPRGCDPGEESYRTEYYDLAKLSQCFLGFYDFINYSLQLPTVRFRSASEKRFLSFLDEQGANPNLVKAYEASHFFSMIPLHNDHPGKMRRFLDRAIELLTAAHP